MEISCCTKDHELLRHMVREFTKREITPSYRERSKKEEWAYDIVRKMGDVGFLGSKLPHEYGGTPETDYVSLGVMIEEVGRGDPTLAFWLASCILNGLIFAAGASNELKQECLPGLIRGELLCGGIITEPECGSDALAIKTLATRNGDCYVVNGEKTSATWLRHAKGALVWVKTRPTRKARDVSILYVTKDLPGVSINYFKDIGLKAASRGSMTFDNVRVPIKNLVGEEGQGFFIISNQWHYMRVANCLIAIGAALASMDETIEYVKQRTAFGSPISKFQGVSFKIAEHHTALCAARLLCYNTLWRLDQGFDIFKDSSMCKSWCIKVAYDAIYDCLLLHGHYGFCEDLPFEQRLRDLIGLEIADAPPSLQKMILARQLIGRQWA